MRRLLAPALGVAFLLALWKLLSLKVASALVLPPPEQVASALAGLLRGEDFAPALRATFLRSALAFVISVLLGTAVGAASAASPFAERFLYAPLWVVKAAPVVSFILLAMFWLNSAQIPAFVAVLMAFPVIAAAVQKGCRAADPLLLEFARFYSLSRLKEFAFIRLHALLPFFAQGAASAYGIVWKAVAAGEVLALPREGLGRLLYSESVHLETASVAALTAAIVSCGAASELLFKFLARRLSSINFRHKAEYGGIANPSVQEAGASEGRIPPCAIRFSSLNVEFDGRRVIDGLSFEAAPSSVTALVAPSGAGKTTLLKRIAAGLLEGGGRVSVIFQEPRLLPQLTLEENVALVLPKGSALAPADFLERVSLLPLAKKLPGEVSGGERQRASLARAFAYPAGALLMDEAFQSQDLATELRLISALAGLLRSERRTVVLATHDLREAAVLAGRILVCSANPLSVRAEIAGNGDMGRATGLYAEPDESVLAAEREVARALLG